MIHRFAKFSSLSVAILVATSACLPGAPIASAIAEGMYGEVDWDDAEMREGNMPGLLRGNLRGDIGTVSVDGPGRNLNGWDEGGFVAINVTTVREDGQAGMVVLNLMGTLADLGTAPAGVYAVNTSGEPLIIDDNGDSYVTVDGTENQGELTEDDSVEVVVCSGPEEGNWEYDQPAEDVILEVEDPVTYTPEEACAECAPLQTRRVTFHSRTRFYDEQNNDSLQTASGSLTIIVDEPVVDDTL